MIQLININKSFDHRLILEDVNLSIHNGTVLGLVGSNGSGKSTILRMIAGVIQADAGVVAINEYDIFDNDVVKQDIFFLADDPYFFVQSSLKDMKQYLKLFYKRFDDEVYHSLLKEFDISETDKLSGFSKGMKRQASLILALASKPKILLLDESLDGLDPSMRFKLKQYLCDIVIDEETIVVISSHSLNELNDICDTIVMIKDGTIEEEQTLNQVQISYHKFQVVFKEIPDHALLDALSFISIKGDQRIYTIIAKGIREDIEAKLSVLNPLIIEHSSISLDEVFRHEDGRNTL